MKIVLNHDEIEQAVRAQILSELPVLENHELSIELTMDYKEVVANISILPMEATKNEPVKTTRAKKVTAATAVKSTETDKAPWVEPEAVQEEDDGLDGMGNPLDGGPMPAPVEAPAPLKIFGNTGTSVPAPATEEPAPAGKSLFANLTKPVHDAPRA